MSRYVYLTASTLNGFLADEQHSLDWLFAVQGESPELTGFMDRMRVLVTGSTTYEWVLRQENLLVEPARWSEFYGDRPMFVFSSRSLPVPAGADVRVVRGEVSTVLPKIAAAAEAGDVWVMGGGDLAGQFLDAGALNEIQVSLAPATVASGPPLLPRRLPPDRLNLRSVERVGQFAHLVYEVK